MGDEPESVMKASKLLLMLEKTPAILLIAMAFFVSFSGPVKAVAAAHVGETEVVEVEEHKFLSQRSHSQRKLRHRRARPGRAVSAAALIAQAPVSESIEARLSFWRRPPHLLRAPPISL